MKTLLLVGLTIPACALTETLSTRRDTWAPNPATCAAAGTCSLREFGIVEMKKRFRMRGEPLAIANHMSDLRIILRTNTVEQIRDYGVVQWIRGCQFSTSWDGQQVTTAFSISRDHMGRPITFRHRDWEVDTDSADPVYHSFDGDRFALWRWNANPASLEAEGSTYTHFREPPHPRVFFTDMPGSHFRSATVYNGIQNATNSSLEFKVCVFKITDLPTATDARGSNIDETKALACHRWSDSQIYDFRAQDMKHPVGIDPRCETRP